MRSWSAASASRRLRARRHAWYARAAAIGLFLWNPWVHERLLIGQWAILAGYLLLPWVALAARGLRRGDRAGWAPAALALVVSAVCSPSSGLMARRRAAGALRRSLARAPGVTVVALGLVANLPWLVPSLLATRTTVSVDEVFELFAARAESAAGVLPSLVSLGGIWKTSVVAGERTSVVIVLASCLLTVAALLGLRHLARTLESRRLLLLALLCLAVAALPTSELGARSCRRVGDVVPAAALLRDSHRFLAPAVLVLALGLAGCVSWLRGPGRARTRGGVGGGRAAGRGADGCCCPSLAWGGGRARPR